jgi:flagellar motility protein MotE (MotC chaperone)
VKKLALILLLVLGMSLSFVAIGLVMLFATGVVVSMDEARALLTGQMPGAESAFLKTGEVAQVQDALLLLRQQKQELEQELVTLREQESQLQTARDSLSEEIGAIVTQGQQQGKQMSAERAKRLEQAVALYSAMRPADAAVIMDQMSDEMILEIIPRLKERQAARILNSLADDERKAKLSALLIEGGAVRGGP